MTARAVCLLAGSLALLAAEAAGALPVVFVDLAWSIRGEASTSAGGISDFDSVSEGDTASGPFSAIDQAEASSASQVLASAQPALSGIVSTDELTLVGAAESSAMAGAPDGFALSSSEALHRIVFEVTRDVTLRLEGRVEAFGDGAGDAFALVELASVDTVVDPLLVGFDAAPGDLPEPFLLDVVLHPGVTYRLLAVARTQSDALASEDLSSFASIFRLEISEVPEPGTAAALGCGLLLVTWRRRRAR